MPLLFIIFIIVPVIEIVLFIQIGGLIGVWTTIAIILLTGVLGMILVRRQGISILYDVQKKAETQQNPLDEIIRGIGLLIAGLLLITPGFFTDALGFALLIPPVCLFAGYRVKEYLVRHIGRGGSGRRRFFYRMREKKSPFSSDHFSSARHDKKHTARIIEGEYQVKEDSDFKKTDSEKNEK